MSGVRGLQMNILQTLNNGELLYGYKSIVLYYEQNVANVTVTKFDARKARWKQYCKKNHIKFYPLKSGNISNFQAKATPFFCYNSGKVAKTKSLFCHLRNAYAHGNVEKIKINNKWWYYCFEDKTDGGNITMRGQIPTGKLKELIHELKENQK